MAQTRKRLKAGVLSVALVAGSLGLAGFAAVAVPGAASAAVPAPPAGFTLTWSDDFSGAANTGLDTGTWKYDTGPGSSFGTGEIETMTNSTANVYQDGAGHLVLKALHSGTDPNSGWTSGRVETQAATFGAPAGGVVMMESSIQQPNVTTTNGAGYWPAFWMLGSTLRSGTPWPTSGEVDILEDINGRSSVFGTLHCGTNPGGPCNESTGIGSGEHPCPGCQTGYHTYAVQIDRSISPEQIRWYLDGTQYFSVNSTQVDATTWSNAVDHPFFIIYDLAMGGGFPAAFGGGPNASTVSGGQMNIDWVAVYNKAPGGGGGGGGGGTNIAQGKPTTASSTENSTFPASNATDGNSSTRWSSAFSDPQWLQVDLGQSYNISHVTLNWEAAYGKAYQIQTSADGSNWTTIYSTTTGDGGTDDLAVTGTGRYIRMYGTARGTPYGYSLYEFAVNGTAASGGGGGTSGVISLRSHANGLYVTADNAGASPLIANKTAIGTWESFDLINNADGSVSLRAHANNDYVTAENAGASSLIANRTAIGSWEEFDLIHNADGSVSFRAHANGDIVTAENAGSSPLIANRTTISTWEEFDLIND
ncbi:MAG TPA: discoidin domain-containing protein [Acidothermaceae bacterium]|jgi:hypothetical protein|nr:discoidin domain-containing protein [Acidothermaceae bacterium]